jgi:hypothetical protein
MKKILCFILGCSICFSIFAERTPEEELYFRSGMPMKDINEMLATCGKPKETSQAEYFCGWRDLIIAERQAQEIIDETSKGDLKYKKELVIKMDRWERNTRKICKKEAHREYAGGSIEPVAAEMCVTLSMQEEVKSMKTKARKGERNIISKP